MIEEDLLDAAAIGGRASRPDGRQQAIERGQATAVRGHHDAGAILRDHVVDLLRLDLRQVLLRRRLVVGGAHRADGLYGVHLVGGGQRGRRGRRELWRVFRLALILDGRWMRNGTQK